MVGLFAFFKRSLREHSRSGALITARAALALTLVVCLALFNVWATALGAAGLEFFATVIFVNALFITVGGCTYFASAIAEEKEDGTLALLRITGTSSLAILLGKGGARLLDGLLLLAVQIPFTLLGVTLGGITWTQVFAAYADLGGYLTLVCSLGLLAGVLADRAAQAVLLSISALVVLLFGGLLFENAFGPASVPSLLQPNIFAELRHVATINFDGPILGAHFAHGLILATTTFFAAWLLFEHFCSETSQGLRLPFDSTQRPLSRALADRRAPEVDPIEWKDYHFQFQALRRISGHHFGYVVLAIVLGGALTVVQLRQSSLRREALDWANLLGVWGVSMLVAGMVLMAVIWLFAISRTIRMERQERTLETLLSLPDQTPENLIKAKTNALRPLLRPAILFAALGYGCLLASYFIGRGQNRPENLTYALLLPFLPIFIWPQFVLLERLVLYASLRTTGNPFLIAVGIWVLWNFLLLLLSALLVFVPLFPLFAMFILPAVVASRIYAKILALIEIAGEKEAS